MSTIQSQRELLKNQKESKQKKTTIIIVSIVLVVANLLALVYFLPKNVLKVFHGRSRSTGELTSSPTSTVAIV